MLYLKQSVAVNVLIGPFIDDTDGKTAETGLTLAQADIRLSKNAGNMAQKNDATGCTHDEIGYYSCPLNTTDTNTLGNLKLMVHQAGSLPVFHDYMVVTANVYDTLCSTDSLDVNLNADQSAATVGTVTALTGKTGFALASTGLDAVVVEGTTTTVQALRLILSLIAGKSSGGGTDTLVYRDTGDTKDRLTFTVDAVGNRTAVTKDAT